MKLKLGDKYKFYLTDYPNVDDRLVEINNLLQTEVEFDNLKCSIEEYLRLTWNKQNTKICLDIIGYYLSKKPNQNGSPDKYVLPKEKEKEMKFGTYKGEQRYVNFTNLDVENKVLFGFDDDKE